MSSTHSHNSILTTDSLHSITSITHENDTKEPTPSITLHALATHHIPIILNACTDWHELSTYGPPYWRPRSEAELQRKIAATQGPNPATEYTFVISSAEQREPATHQAALMNANTSNTNGNHSDAPSYHDSAASNHTSTTFGLNLIGECSLHAIDWRNRVASIGICIWNPTHRRNGYGSQVVTQLINWAHNELNLARLEAWILDSNSPSKQLFDRLGFVQEGTLLKRYIHGGLRYDVCVYGCMF